ncbi:MAG: WYL domain-containing protein [Candidatus Dormibacteraeota bacterium]|nr:WYL domain-containing protein [Candidatus Dormibacteraeota bacterium]
MRADRLLSILLLLQAHGRMSAKTIAERLEVSERTVYRDIDALSAAGIPVYTERGRQGGCALLPGYRTDVSGLSALEARALFVFAGGGTLKELGLDHDLKQALRKLMASLAEAQRSGAIQAQQRIVVEPRGWMRQAEPVPHLAAVQEAVWGERRLEVTYRRSGASAARRLSLDPYGLVAKAGIWYLIAAEDGEPHLYRVSRIESVTSIDEPARRPAGLDLDALWQELRRRVEDRGAGVAVRLRIRLEQTDRVLRICGPQLVAPATLEAADEASGWATYQMQFVAEGAARGALLGFGTDVELLSPSGLRAAFAETAGAIFRLYREREP